MSISEPTTSRFRTTGRFSIYALAIFLFWSGAFACNLIALCFLPWSGSPKVRYRARVWLRRLMLLARKIMETIRALKFDLTQTDSLVELRGTVIVANHPSLMDAVFLLGLIPDSVCIIKRSLQRNIALNPMSRLCGFIANDGGPDLIREAGTVLSEGCNLIVFPEGTRSQGRLNPFKPGFALIALRGGHPIQTVHLSINPALLPKGALVKNLPHTRPLIKITPGLNFTPTPGLRPADLALEVERHFLDRA